MRNLIITTAISLLGANVLFAQNEVDALRYSQPFINGTARFNSMGGAFTALGGDLTCINQNPAGLAVYRRSEILTGINLFSQSTQSSYLGINTSNGQMNFNIPNFGFLFYNKIDDSDYGWVSNYFAFSINKTNYFHNKISIEGNNSKNSLTTFLVDKYNSGNGTYINNLDGFIAGPLFNIYVLDTLPGTNNKYRSPFYKGGVNQTQNIDLSGRMSEVSFSFGGNYREKLLLGGAFSINSIRFEKKALYTETDINDTIKYLKSFSVNENLTSKGYGINAKLGFIYKPIDWVRIGGAVIAPTVYGMTDNYSTHVTAKWDSVGDMEQKIKGAAFEYQVTSPLKANAGVAFIIGKQGLLSADYEYFNYTQARLNSSTYNFSSENAAISTKYTAVQNVRLGGEIRLDPFALRGGFGLYGSPYSTGFNTNASRTFYTGGLGYREENFFMDLSLLLMNQKEFYYLYSSKYVDEVQNNFKITSVTFSIGFKF